ncbi:MAG: XdhC family protein [Anaerolineaceae bacterium]|nr:XdhC family protein [Anaerolineaceae bacterium]
MRELFTQILYEIEKKHDTVLVTLTGSDGSAPRKTGSQMLAGASGRIFGTVGGGAVEMRSAELAKQLTAEKRSMVHTFRLNTNPVEDIGMICGGDVTAAFQFIPADDPVWTDLAGKALERIAARRGGWFFQRFDGGTPGLLDEAFRLLSGRAPEGPEPAGNAPFSSGNGFWMPLPVPERVLIFGGGHIAASLVPLLNTVGFRCWVFDDRPEYTTAERFPGAEKRITGDFTRIADHIEITAEDYAVVMTSGHIHDFEVQNQVLRSPFAYIGVIGSRKKTASVNARLREQGISEEAIAKIHTPIGVPIKAVTPEEIAVSIAGELILVRAERRM